MSLQLRGQSFSETKSRQSENEVPFSRQMERAARNCFSLFPQPLRLGIMIKKYLHTRYRVDDLEKTTDFYANVLGLKETRRHTSPRGSKLVFFELPGSDAELELCSFPDSGGVHVQEDLTHLAFEVEDIETFAREAAAKGYPLSDGPTETSSGSIIAFIDAPEGYEIELIQKPAT